MRIRARVLSASALPAAVADNRRLLNAINLTPEWWPAECA